jgi:hypothetical protein
MSTNEIENNLGRILFRMEMAKSHLMQIQGATHPQMVNAAVLQPWFMEAVQMQCQLELAVMESKRLTETFQNALVYNKAAE